METCRILLPGSYKQQFGLDDELLIKAHSVDEVIKRLQHNYPLLSEHLFDDSANPKRYVNIYLNGINIRDLSNKELVITSGSELNIILAVAGG